MKKPKSDLMREIAQFPTKELFPFIYKEGEIFSITFIKSFLFLPKISPGRGRKKCEL
jgi:hypothetical protein